MWCGACGCGTACSSAVQKNGGANLRAPRRTVGWLPLLCGGLLLPALGCFLCHANPPFHPCGCASGSSAPAPVRCRLARVGGCRMPSPRGRRPVSRGPRLACTKRWGCSWNTPCGLPLLRGLLLAARGLLRSFLRHFSSWSGGCSACPPLSSCNNGWSEPSTLIQDVDYG